MGFNLNKLKKQYGVGSAAKLGYAGATNPGETFAYNADAKNAAKEAITEEAQLAAYNAQKANSASDRAAYDNYSAQYDQRLQGAPMYVNKQFAGSKRVAPNTVNEMYEKYLGRENENNNMEYPAAIGYGPTPEQKQRLYDDENRQVNDAQRNQFIRDSNTELAERGINNTGNQYMMNQMGNYYGNVLGAPVYGGGMGTPVINAPVDVIPEITRTPVDVIPEITLIGDTSVIAKPVEIKAELGEQMIGDTLTDTDMSTDTPSTFDLYGSQIDQLMPIYLEELGRGIQDPGALAYYGEELKSGRMTPEQVRANISGSIEGKQYDAAQQAAAQNSANLGFGTSSTTGNAADDAAQLDTYNHLGNFFGNDNDNSLVSSNITDSSYVNPAATPVGMMPSTAVTSPLALANITGSNINSGMGNTLSTVGGLGNEDALMDLIGAQDYYDSQNSWQQNKIDKNNAFDTASELIDSYYPGGDNNKSYNNTNTVNKYTNSANAGAKSGYRTGLARGGYIKGYDLGGEVKVEEETVIAPNTTLEGDPLDMDALIEEATLPTPAMSPNVIAMRKMLQNSQKTSQDAGIESLGQEYNTSVGAYQKAMANLASQESKGPSESEKWFRIAAAFGKPTQSGNFFDGLSNVSGALGDIEAERRAAQSTGNQLLLENSRFGMDLLKEQLATATLLQTDERNYNRNLQELFLTTENERMLLAQERAYDILSEQEKRQWESDNKKSLPQTVAAKAASDLGYKRGDEDYIKYVTDYYEREQARKDLEIKTLSDQANRLTKPELDLSVETDKYIVGQNSAIALLEQALELNENSYTSSFGDSIAMYLKGKTNPSDPKYVATEKLMNVLSKGALATLKATFGGNISDGERAANLDLQGLNSMSLKARREIIDQALQMMIRERDRNKAKLLKIRDGSYATRDKTVENK